MKRGSPLRSKSPPARRTPLRAKRWGIAPKPARRIKREGAAEGREYLAFVRTLPCVVAGLPGAGPCRGPMTASHIRSHTGMGLKPDDLTATPKCKQHHLEHWEVRRGAFAGWSEAQRQRWASAVIGETQARARAAGVLLPTAREAKATLMRVMREANAREAT